MKRTCQLIKNIIDDNFDCTQLTSVSELFCDSNVLTHPLSVANKSNEYFSHVLRFFGMYPAMGVALYRPNFV